MDKIIDRAAELADTIVDNPTTYSDADNLRELLEELVKDTTEEAAKTVRGQAHKVGLSYNPFKAVLLIANKAIEEAAKAVEESIK